MWRSTNLSQVDNLQHNISKAQGLASIIETLFENYISPTAIMDRDFNFIKVNKAYAQTDNREPDYFIGRNHFELYPSDYEAIFKQVVETKKTYYAYAQPFIYEFNTERGITYWDWTLSPLLDEKGEVFLLILSLNNITERVKSLAEINNFFNISTDILCIHDYSGKILKTNFSFERLLGYNLEEINTQSLFNFVHPEDRAKTKNFILNSLKYSSRDLLENRFRHKNNTYMWFEWNIVPDLNRKLIYAIGRDITLRKNHEKTIGFLASIVNSSEDAIITKDLKGNILSWNKGAEKIYGYLADEVIGKKDIIFAPPGLKYDPEAEILERVAKGEHVKNYESVRRRKDGKLIFLSKTVSPIYDNMNKIIGSSTIAKDISDQKHFETEIIKLDRLNILGELAASISHEVRNPLTTLKGFLQLLIKKELYQEDRKYFNIMIDELDRANSLISEFLSIGKTSPIKFNLSDLNGIINKLVPLLQADAMAKNNYIKLELGPIPQILLNEKQIRQVIINLVRNGLEAMKSGGKLTIRTFEEKENVVLAIEDEGCGIPQEIFNNLGKAFITTKKDGTGLGLTTSFSICKKHGAKINVKTSPQGSTFEIFFNKTLSQEQINNEYYLMENNPYLYNEQFFKTFFNAIPLPIIIMNSNGNVYFVNPPAEEMLQLKHKNIYFKKGEEILNCIVKKSFQVCGNNDVCDQCIVKISAMNAIKENSIIQDQKEFYINTKTGELKKLHLLVTSAPLVYKEEKMAIIFIQNFSELLSLA